jgi:hypothetical protein
VTVRACVVVGVVLLLSGCRSKDDMPDWPPFAMTIPDDVPEQLTIIEKDGTQYEANGKKFWADGYRAGWKRCAWEFERGYLNLAVEKPEPPLIGHCGIVVRGWDAGYLACFQAIRETMKAS